MKEYPFKIKGSSIIRAVVSEERDKYLAKASLAKLTKYLPKLDGENVDLLGVAFDAFIGNRFNLNHDGSDAETSVKIAKLFVNKPININHNRKNIIGVVLNYAFTKFGTNDPLSEEEALATKDPFNVVLGGVVWRVASSDVADLIEEASDPTSDKFQTVSASWEIGFLDFVIAAIDSNSKNLIDAKIISDKDEIDKLKGYMKAYEGKGSKDNVNLYRLIKGEAIPLGIGLTETPAADVKGVATEKTEVEEPKEETKANKKEDIINNISQTEKIVVIEERKAIAMKINKIEDITDENLKQTNASEISEWVKSELRVANEQFVADKTKLENDVKASKEAFEKLTTEHQKIQEDLKKAQEVLAALENEKQARAKQDIFNTRMAKLDAEYNLDNAIREIIASEIINLDDTAFASYEKKLEVLIAAKKKTKEAEKTEKVEEKKETKKTSECKASSETKEVVESAVENSNKEKEKLPATASAQENKMDKFAKAFGIDQWISDIKLTD